MLTFEAHPEAFDADGNMISINNTNLLSCDFENRLSQAALSGTTNTYQYDSSGNRMFANRRELITRSLLDRASPLAIMHELQCAEVLAGD